MCTDRLGLHCALLAGARMIWFAKFDPTAVIKRPPEATVFMGVPTLYVRLLANASPQLNFARPAPTCGCLSRDRRRC